MQHPAGATAAAAAVHAAKARPGRRGGPPAVTKDLGERKRAPPRGVEAPARPLLPPAPEVAAELADRDAGRLAGTTPPNANGADATRLLEVFMAGMP